MRPSLRTSLSLLVFTLAMGAVIWMGTRPASRLSPVLPPAVQVDRSLVEEVVPPVEEVNMEVLHDFQTWIDQFRSGVRGEAFMEQGRVIAEQRRVSMLQLIQQSSSAALGASLSYAEYDALPEELQALVEEPFTMIGDVQVTAICDHDDHTPEYHVNIYLEDQTRLRVGHEDQARTGISKLDVPIQGVRLDGWAALEATVFELLEGADADWAWKNLPIGNPDPGLDFFTGEPLGANPITAVAGGFTFLFSSEETLAELEQLVRGFDDLPGRYTGSSVIFSEEVQEVQAKGFPTEIIQDSQLQLSINDTTGDKTTLFIRVVFSDKLEAPISKADLETQINGAVSTGFVNYSYNQTSMSAVVTDNTYQVSMVSTEYAFTGGGDSIDEQDLFDEAVALYQVDVPGDGTNWTHR